MPRTNPLNRRLTKLQDEWTRRSNAMEVLLFQPSPPFQVKMNEQDAFRRYLDDEANGTLFNDRESNGGFRPDAEMDKYVSWGERMKAKYVPQMLLNDTIGKASVAAGQPWDFHGLDQHQHVDDAEQHAPEPGIDQQFAEQAPPQEGTP